MNYHNTENYNKETGSYVTVEIKESMHDVVILRRGYNINGSLHCMKASEFENKEEVIIKFQNVIKKDKENRLKKLKSDKILLYKSREFPKVTHFVCNNVTIHAVERFDDYQWTYNNGCYLAKQYWFYFDNRLLQGTFRMPIEHKIDLDFILTELHIHSLSSSRYSYNSFSVNGDETYIQETTINEPVNILPMYEFLGKIVRFKDAELTIKDLNFNFNPRDYMKYEIIGELQGIEMMSILMNKMRYYE